MTAPFGELITRARTFVRDEGASFIDDDDLGNWINEAQTDLAARTEVLDHEVTGTTSDNIAFPTPDMVTFRSLRLGTDDVEFVSDDDFNIIKDLGVTSPNTIARVFDDVIELYPTPEADTEYTLRYSQIPYGLVQPNDLHSLPLQMERKLIEYAVAQAKYKDGDPGDGDRWLARYEQGLPPVSTGRERQQTGPLSFARRPNAWDMQPDRKHV